MEELERITESIATMAREPLTQRPYRVFIIGAGLAGLSAAEALVLGSRSNAIPEGMSVEVNVLEAMDKPGGRAITLPFAGGFIEGGAQFIHGRVGNATYERAKQHRLQFGKGHPVPLTTSLLQPDGSQVPNSIAAEVNNLYSNLILHTQVQAYEEERRKSGDHTVGAFIKRHFERYYRAAGGSPGGKRVRANMFRMLTIMECCYSACHSLCDLMLRDFGEYEELIGNETLEGGYSELVNTFLESLPAGAITYSKPVQQVDWGCKIEEDKDNGYPIAIVTEDGERYHADYLIVTASLGYLKENAHSMFSPPLPREKLDLVERMGFGTTAKIWLEYEAPFWAENWGGFFMVWDENPRDVMRDKFTKKEWFKDLYGVRRLEGNPRVLIVWVTGKGAEYCETLDNADIGKTLTGILRKFLRDPSIPPPTHVKKTGWHSNPFVRGSYSYVAAGSEGADIDRLADPVCIPGQNGVQRPVICFAGEATHRTFYSTTHGALLSGQREARRILTDIRLRVASKQMNACLQEGSM